MDRHRRQPSAVVSPPVWRASTHLYPDMAPCARHAHNEDGRFYYGRRGAPTQWALAEALTQIEPGAAGTVLYPSGWRPLRACCCGAEAGRRAADDRQCL
jgi:cystathionine beta-lyase/cystathionine gamma-synthase